MPSEDININGRLKITLRQGEIEDYQLCVRALLLEGQANEILKGALASGECHLAAHDGNVVGLVTFNRHFFQRHFITLLVVKESMRRRGIGMQLIKTVERLASGDKLFTSTNQSNAAAQALFERAGFVRSGLVENLDPGDSEIIFCRDLTNSRQAPRPGA